MSSKSGMYCEVCNKLLKDSEHIALNEKGTLIFMCNECYDSVKIFFK